MPLFPYDNIKVGSLLLSVGDCIVIITQLQEFGFTGFNVNHDYYPVWITYENIHHLFKEILVE